MSQAAILPSDTFERAVRIAPNTRHVVAAISLLSLAGAGAVLIATRWGVGLNNDSVAYIAAARDLLHGRGFPTAHWPPLFPAALALLGLLGVDPLAGARWLNTALFAANIVLVGLIVARYGGGLLWTSALAAFLMLANMLFIHSMAWSEPLFFFLGLAGILCMAAYLDGPRPVLLLASAGAVGCAVLTRYVGGALVVTGALGLLLLSKKTPWARLIDAAVFSGVSSLPTLLWMMRNVHVAGSATDRVAVFHPVAWDNIMFGFLTLSAWLIPQRVPDRAIIFLLLAVGWAAASVAVRTRNGRKGDRRAPRADLARLPILLGIFIASYLGLLIVAISFVDQALLDERTLSPVFVTGLILVSCMAADRWRSGRLSRSFRVCAVLVAGYLASLYAFHGGAVVIDGYREGFGYAAERWRTSETIRGVEALPHGLLIYSNFPNAVYIFTGRPATLIPMKIDYVSGLHVEAYSRQLFEMRDRLQQGKAVLVIFDRALQYLPGETKLDEDLQPLTLIKKTRDGQIYRMKDAQIPGL